MMYMEVNVSISELFPLEVYRDLFVHGRRKSEFAIAPEALYERSWTFHGMLTVIYNQVLAFKISLV